MRATIKDIAPDRVRYLLNYDCATGDLTWVSSPSNSVKAGSVAGGLKENGYRQIRLDGRKYYAHRIAWLHMHGKWPEGDIDHINGRRSDNRIENMRDVHHAVNCQNMRKAKPHNKSGFLGVDKRKESGKFRAAIILNGKQKHVGSFDTAEVAHAAYVAAKRAIHSGCTI